jgi:hypothetical protein
LVLFGGAWLPRAQADGQGQPPGVYQTDAAGRTFRVRFDPGNRVRIGLGFGLLGADRELAADGELQLGLDLRRVLDFGQGGDLVSWQLSHRILSGWLRPWRKAAAGAPVLDLSVYQGTFMRHSESSTLTLPSDPPRRLFFPLDFGFEVELGRLALPAAGQAQELRLGVARAALVLDPWRTGRPGDGLQLGVGVRYDLDLAGASTLAGAAPVHRLAPFTAAFLRFRLEDQAGLTALDLRADLAPHWASRGGWGLSAEGQARFERVLLAINDLPLAVTVEAHWIRRPPAEPVGATQELRVVGGLSMGIPLR